MLPLDDVDSGDIELVGRFAELVDRLTQALNALGETSTIDAWADTMARITDSLTATTAGDAWQRAQLAALLDELVGQATARRHRQRGRTQFDDVRSIMADRLKGRPTAGQLPHGASHRLHARADAVDPPPGGLPARVSTTAASRATSNATETTSPLATPRVGDRDARSEDRQLLLDALLAATTPC